MDEMNYVATAISALGEKIDSLESDLRMKKWNIRDLEEENKKLKDKFEEVKQYIDAMKEPVHDTEPLKIVPINSMEDE